MPRNLCSADVSFFNKTFWIEHLTFLGTVSPIVQHIRIHLTISFNGNFEHKTNDLGPFSLPFSLCVRACTCVCACVRNRFNIHMKN